jgi:hypothetical protein
MTNTIELGEWRRLHQQAVTLVSTCASEIALAETHRRIF